MSMYCTLSHRKIHGWGHMRLVEQHNGREIDTPAREEDRPMPIEQLAGDGDMVDRTRALLTAKGVPHKLRKNNVLAYEDVYGASPGYWDIQYPDGWKNAPVEDLERDPVAVALMQHVKRKYGEKLVSVRLHLDEKSPHWHVVSVPLVTRMHKQRGRKRKDGVVPPPIEKTTLYASHETERGGSGRRLEIEHDEWAEATAHLGLVRGARGSDLTEEERRERRIRDTQSSRQGEERARLRKEERDRVEAAARRAEADEFDMMASAAIEANALVANAAALEEAARTSAAEIIATARIDGDAIRADAKADAQQVAKDRRALDIATAQADRAKVRIDARETAVARREAEAGDLLAKLEKALARAVSVYDRIMAGPAVVRAWLSGETEIIAAVREGPSAVEGLRPLVKGRAEDSEPSVVDLAIAKAARDGRSGM